MTNDKYIKKLETYIMPEDTIEKLKIRFGITPGQHKIVMVHLGIMILSLFIGIAYDIAYWFTNSGGLIFALVFLIWVFTVLSLLDYLDIIQFRKTVERKTKCAICGRTSKGSSYDEDGKIIKTIVEDGPKGTRETVEKTHEEKPAVPLEGVIIADKLICSDCVKKVGKIKWDQ